MCDVRCAMCGGADPRKWPEPEPVRAYNKYASSSLERTGVSSDRLAALYVTGGLRVIRVKGNAAGVPSRLLALLVQRLGPARWIRAWFVVDSSRLQNQH